MGTLIYKMKQKQNEKITGDEIFSSVWMLCSSFVLIILGTAFIPNLTGTVVPFIFCMAIVGIAIGGVWSALGKLGVSNSTDDTFKKLRENTTRGERFLFSLIFVTGGFGLGILFSLIL